MNDTSNNAIRTSNPKVGSVEWQLLNRTAERDALQAKVDQLMQQRDDYKADYLRMHKMFMDLKYPDTVPAHETSDVLDAAKWRALRNCARITAIGSAGMGPERAADDYAHITLNFWTGVPDGDPGPAYAREWLDTFVDKALRGSLKANSVGPQCNCQGEECHGIAAASAHGHICRKEQW